MAMMAMSPTITTTNGGNGDNNDDGIYNDYIYIYMTAIVVHGCCWCICCWCCCNTKMAHMQSMPTTIRSIYIITTLTSTMATTMTMTAIHNIARTLDPHATSTDRVATDGTTRGNRSWTTSGTIRRWDVCSTRSSNCHNNDKHIYIYI